MKLHLDLPWGGVFEYERPAKEQRLTEGQITGVLCGVGALLFLFLIFGLPLILR